MALATNNLIERWERVQFNKVEKITSEELEYICSVVDLKTVLSNLGIETEWTGENELKGYCPDHFKRTGRSPSDPRWYLNTKTGKCICFTESRGSNIVCVIKNLLGLKSLKEAKEYLLNGNKIPSIFELNKMTRVITQTNKELNKKQKHDEQLKEAEKVLKSNKISKKALDFFQKDAILSVTLNKLNVCCLEEGRYANRAILPFIDNNQEIVGFVAIETIGKKEWVKRKVRSYIGIHGCKSLTEIKSIIVKARKSYKKVIFCTGSPTGQHVYGLNEYIIPYCLDTNKLVLVEGERDAIKLLQEGFSALSCHGAKLTSEQMEIILSLNPKEIYLAFDGDEAGRVATKKAFKMLENKVDYVIPMDIPIGKDPKKFNGEEFSELMETEKRKHMFKDSPFER